MRPLGLLIGFAADRILGDPQRFHPVAGFGWAASALERRCYADSRHHGAAFTATLVGGTVLIGAVTERATRGQPLAHTLVTAVATWAVLGGRSLEREATAIDAHLAAGDLAAARRRLTHLVARETTNLSEYEIARAVVESVAENTSDAVVAPLFWGAVAGVPGLLGYRAINTLDAMVGYRNDRYRRFGWASARLDDAANLAPARAGGLLVCAADPAHARAAWRTWRRDAAAHPSPNAGVVESAFAGALGIRLGGTNTYHGTVEHRVVMGDGRAPTAADIARTNALARRVGRAAAASAALLAFRHLHWNRRKPVTAPSRAQSGTVAPL